MIKAYGVKKIKLIMIPFKIKNWQRMAIAVYEHTSISCQRRGATVWTIMIRAHYNFLLNFSMIGYRNTVKGYNS
jgi:hypothetical protein